MNKRLTYGLTTTYVVPVGLVFQYAAAKPWRATVRARSQGGRETRSNVVQIYINVYVSEVEKHESA